MNTSIQAALAAALPRLRALELGDAFDPRAAQVLVDAGLHALCVPADQGGLGATMREAAEVLLALGAVDGSTALGFAMQVHTTGALRDGTVDPDLRSEVFRSVLADGCAPEQRRDGGGWRVAGPWRHPGHDRRACSG